MWSFIIQHNSTPAARVSNFDIILSSKVRDGLGEAIRPNPFTLTWIRRSVGEGRRVATQVLQLT